MTKLPRVVVMHMPQMKRQVRRVVVHMDTVTEDGLVCGNMGTYFECTLNKKEVTCKNCIRIMRPKRGRRG